jgi:hypothetical protein
MLGTRGKVAINANEKAGAIGVHSMPCARRGIAMAAKVKQVRSSWTGKA